MLACLHSQFPSKTLSQEGKLHQISQMRQQNSSENISLDPPAPDTLVCRRCTSVCPKCSRDSVRIHRKYYSVNLIQMDYGEESFSFQTLLGNKPQQADWCDHLGRQRLFNRADRKVKCLHLYQSHFKAPSIGHKCSTNTVVSMETVSIKHKAPGWDTNSSPDDPVATWRHKHKCKVKESWLLVWRGGWNGSVF